MNKSNNSKGILNQISMIRELSNGIIERELKQRNLVGILPAHGTILKYLFLKKKAVSIKEIVENSNRVKSTVTSILNTLESYDYVKRIADDNDKRSVKIELTKKGKEIEQHFNEISEIILKKVYRNISEEEKNILAELLKIIEGNLR